MPGLIEEIQRDCLNDDVKTEQLLHRVKLAAAKLRLENLDQWIEGEIVGYKGDLPDYRIISGDPKMFNPYNGWIPVICDQDWLLEIISKVPISQSVSSLTDLLNSSTSSKCHMPISPALISKLAVSTAKRNTRRI